MKFLQSLILVCLIGTAAFGDVFMFTKIGSYCDRSSVSNAVTRKSYYTTELLRGIWIEALTICKAFDMELAILKTLDEADAVNQMIWSHKSLFSTWIVIDGASKALRSRTDWFFTQVDEKISFNIPWKSGQPDGLNDKEQCLTLWLNGDRVQFNDVPCYSGITRPFLCQKIEAFTDDCSK